MITHLLDTDTCIALLRGNDHTVKAAKQHSPEHLAIASITRYELAYGVLRCGPKRSIVEQEKVQRFLSMLSELPFTRKTAEITALLRFSLERDGTPIGPMDVQIAATAQEHQLTLVSGNLNEFSGIADLKVEDWMRN